MTIRLKNVPHILCLILASCKNHQSEKVMHKHTNSLIHESSPYLLQHAYNPVNWKAWNIENLAEAKSMGKPILISIGYSSCHWCHVMENESFEDEQVALFMNENFYCIKVDKEERPDVDQIYMTAANIITGSGGWPLNCFALPDGRPFHAGTYYPKEGWLRLLETVHFQYTNHLEKLQDYATRLTQGIRMQETAISDNVAQKLDFDFISQAVNGWKTNWDMKEGGMTKAPKFPLPSHYDFLLSYSAFVVDNQVDDFIKISLEKMAKGGIYDQIGGGFARYSTDIFWKVPHFEKMMYDNGQLLSIYAQAYKKESNPIFLSTMNETIAWIEREMLDKSGLFYSALDADSEGEEGRFYVWQEDELKNLLKSDFQMIKDYYNVGNKGLWEHGNNILLRSENENDLAKKYKLTDEQLREKIEQVNKVLLQNRNKRISPGLDDKCLTSWNGLAISGLCEAYKVTLSERYKELAVNAINAILTYQHHENELFHSFKNGKSTINGMLEDYAFTIQSCLSVFEITGEELYANKAQALTKQAITKFYDAEKELFYFNVDNELIVRTTEIYDNVIPSTNSVMANVLIDVGLLIGNTQYLTLAENLIGKIQENISSYPGGHSNWARAHLKLSKPYFEIAISGSNAATLAKEFWKLNLTNCAIYFASSASELGLFEYRYSPDTTQIFVCKKGECKLPVGTTAEALKILHNE